MPEFAIKNEEIPADYWPAFRHALDTVTIGIRENLPENTGTMDTAKTTTNEGTSELSVDDMISRLESLKLLLDDDLFSAKEEFDRLKPTLSKHYDIDGIKKLETYLDDFDIDHAQEHILAIIEHMYEKPS